MFRALIAWILRLFGWGPKPAPPLAPDRPIISDAAPPAPALVTFPVPITAHLYIAPSGIYPMGSLGEGSLFTMGMIHALIFDPDSFSGPVFDGVEAKGQVLPTPQNEEMTSLLGGTYGGDLPVTFALPDLRGNAMWGPYPDMQPWPNTVPVTWLIAATSQPAPQYPPGPAAPLAGMIMPYAGQGAIDGWLECTNATYDPRQYPELFTAIGGNFDLGSSPPPGGLHALPDLGWRVVMGAGGAVNGMQVPAAVGMILGEQSAEKTLWALCVNYLICLNGQWPYTEPPRSIPSSGGWAGQIVAYGGLTAPPGWAICDGSLLQIQNYQELFMMIGNQFGGDGATTFAVPDLRGKMLVGSN